MKVSHPHRIILSLVASLILSVLIFYYENHTSFELRKRYYLTWAEHLSHQFELTTEYARKDNKPDPLRWAMHLLGSNSTQSPMHMELIALKEGGLPTESFEFELNQGVFRFDKIIDPQTGRGIRIRLNVPYSGFLGTSSLFNQDFALILLFVFLFNTFLILLSLFPFHEKIN